MILRPSTILSVAAICGTCAFIWCLAHAPPEPWNRTRRPGFLSAAATWPHDPEGLTRYVQRHPERLRAWYELAQRRRNADDAPGAAAAWKEAAALAAPAVLRFPKDPTVPFMLAWASEQTGDAATAAMAYKTAAERYQRSLGNDPDNADFWRDLGWCRARTGDAAGAIDAWKRGAEVQGRPGENAMGSGALYNLACFRALSGDRDGALEALEHAAQSGWDDWRWTAHDEDLESLHDQDRFRNVIDTIRGSRPPDGSPNVVPDPG